MGLIATFEERLGTPLTVVTSLAMVLAVVALVAGLDLPEQAAVALVYLAGGVPATIRALANLFRNRVLDIDLLMVIAALAALAVDEAFEGAILLFLFSLSTTLERHAMGRARRAVEALMALRPETALRRGPDGAVTEVPAVDLRPGDMVVVRPGARVPVDGVVRAGSGQVDESTITGESMPVTRAKGAQVFEATVNLNSVLEVEVSRSAADSTVARMIRLVTEAQAAKAPSERFSAWFGQRYTVAVLAGSVLALGVFLWLGWSRDDALYRAATLLVAASPCAIVISVPAAILSALSAAARGGVLFKGGAALETFGAVRSFAFDKTGTLTTGRARVTGVMPLGTSEEKLLALAAGLEAQSEHPVAEAIRGAAEARAIAPDAVHEVQNTPSEGVTGAHADGTSVWAGNARMAERMGADTAIAALARLHDGAQTVVFLGQGRTLLGAISVADTLRETSRPALAALRAGGIERIEMLTGDRHPVALRIGRELGLRDDEIASDLLPEEKVALVARMRRAGKVAFVGDGVNDAAALASADVGIAMGAAGSEVAIQAADVALLSEDMSSLAAAYKLARRTNRVIRQNLIFAVGAMVLLVIGTLFFALPLPLAVLGHEGGTLLVVLNGMRLLFDPIRMDRRPGRSASQIPASP